MLMSDISNVADAHFEQSIAEQIWQQKYRYVSGGQTVDRTV